MYLIEIAHPSRLDAWNVVDSVSTPSEASEILAAPHFEWFRGLLVRVREEMMDVTLYDGVYTDSTCVDVSAQSNFMIRYRGDSWEYGEGGIVPQKELNLWEEYHRPIKASLMIKAFERFVGFEIISRAVSACAETVIPLADEYADRLRKNLGPIEHRRMVKNKILDEFGYDDERLDEMFLMGSDDYSRVMKIRCAITAVFDLGYGAVIDAENACFYGGVSSDHLIDIVRREIPFHVVAASVD